MNPKCSCCHSYFGIETKSSGLTYKTCLPCRIRKTSKKCPHQRVKSNCADCNPCPHQRRKGSCADCNPCPHQRLKSNCADCNPCPHQRLKPNCIVCNPCPHQRLKPNCIDCNPCPHQRLKHNCVDCNPCPHQRLKENCRECNDALILTIQRFINGSKQSDKKYNRFDIANFIDNDFCKLLIEECNDKCCYCNCDLEYIKFGFNLISIERIDNTIGHIKSNVKIACYHCNIKKVGDNNNNN